MKEKMRIEFKTKIKLRFLKLRIFVSVFFRH